MASASHTNAHPRHSSLDPKPALGPVYKQTQGTMTDPRQGGRVSTPYRFNLYAPAKEEARGRKEQTREARTLARPKGFAWSLVASLGRCMFGPGSSVGAPSPADPLIR